MNLNLSENTLDINSNNFDAHIKPAYPNVKSVIRLFFVILFYMIIFGIAAGILLVVLDTYNLKLPLLRSFLSFLMYVITMLVTIRYAIKKSKKQEGVYFGISFNKIPIWLIPVIVISTIALVVFLERVASLIPMPVSVQKFFEKAFSKDIFSIITMVIAAPVLEEILCRGIVLRGLLKNYPDYKAILISAIFFAAIHMNPWQAVPAFFGGLFLGWIYYKTQSVIPGMIIHATINSTASIFLFLPNNHQSFLNLLGLTNYIILCALSVLIFSAGCIIIQKRMALAPEPIGFNQE
ncbi:MAG TPA: type II CAAX endopeptidase family protein [Mucilaginibacter sp.]|jgi:membrane protease YdiL (CAAX protease family)|nr:type II CAAX endopeptidase family protein [Mucilaginibacter sp.]